MEHNTPPVRILHLDDNPSDALLIKALIDEVNYELSASVELVSTKEAYLSALRSHTCHLILSDYRMSGYDGDDALKDAKLICPDVPFIMVTGELGEERAIETLKAGAIDYVLKDRIKRLVPSIKRALKDAQLEQERRETTTRLIEAQRIAHIGNWEWNIQTGAVYWSAETFSIYGVDPAAFVPTFDAFAQFVHPDDREFVNGKITEILDRRVAVRFDFRIIASDGSGHVLHTVGEIIRWDAQGKPLVMAGTNQDITERKRAEEELAEAYNQIQSIIDNTPAIVYAFDLEGRFVLANTALAELLNSTPGAMLGKRRREFMPREDADWHEANDRRVIEAGKAMAFEEYSELPGRAITWLTTKFPLRDAQGKIYAVAGISSDISERRRAEEELKRSNQKINQILTSIQEDFYVVDANWTFVYANERFTSKLGKQPEDLVGKNLWELFPNHVRSVLGENFRKSMERQEIRHFEMSGEYTDAWYSVGVYPTPEGITVLGSDITERKRAEEALKESQERIRHIARFPEENPHPILRVTAQGILLYANSSSSHILKSWNCTIGEELPGDWKRLIEKAFSGGENVTQEAEYDGRVYSFVVVPVTTGPYVNLYGRDISEQKRIEAELHKSEREKAEFFESVKDPFYGLDSEWRYTYINAEAARFMAKDRVELLGKVLWDVFPRVRGSESERQLRKAMEERTPVHYETRATLNNVWVSVHIFPKADGGLSVLYQDIDQRKTAEQQVERDVVALTAMHGLSQKILEPAAFEELLQEIMDTAVKIVNAERGTLQLLEGESLRIVTHHGHKEPFLAFFASAEARASVCGEATRRGERVIVPDIETSSLFSGTDSLPILREAGVRAVQSTPILTRSGVLLGILTTQWSQPYMPDEHDLWRIDLLARQAAELIERKRAEGTLKESEARFHALADNIPQLAWMTDETGWMFWYNQRWYDYTGTTFEEMKGWGWQKVHHPDHVERVTEHFRRAVGEAQSWEDTFPLRSKTGEYRWFLSRAYPIKDEQGKIKRWFGTNTDITDQRQAAEALKASEENLRLMVDHATEAMMVVGRSGVIEAVSDLGSARLGYQERELLGHNVSEFAEILSRLETLLALENLRKNAPRPVTLSMRIRTKKAGMKWMSITGSFINLGTKIEKYFVRFQTLELPLRNGGPPEQTHDATEGE